MNTNTINKIESANGNANKDPKVQNEVKKPLSCVPNSRKIGSEKPCFGFDDFAEIGSPTKKKKKEDDFTHNFHSKKMHSV